MSVKRKVTVPVVGLLIAALGSRPKGTGLCTSRERPANPVDRPAEDGEEKHRECDCADEELELHGQQDDGRKSRRRCGLLASAGGVIPTRPVQGWAASRERAWSLFIASSAATLYDSARVG